MNKMESSLLEKPLLGLERLNLLQIDVRVKDTLLSPSPALVQLETLHKDKYSVQPQLLVVLLLRRLFSGHSSDGLLSNHRAILRATSTGLKPILGYSTFIFLDSISRDCSNMAVSSAKDTVSLLNQTSPPDIISQWSLSSLPQSTVNHQPSSNETTSTVPILHEKYN